MCWHAETSGTKVALRDFYGGLQVYWCIWNPVRSKARATATFQGNLLRKPGVLCAQRSADRGTRVSQKGSSADVRRSAGTQDRNTRNVARGTPTLATAYKGAPMCAPACGGRPRSSQEWRRPAGGGWWAKACQRKAIFLIPPYHTILLAF